MEKYFIVPEGHGLHKAFIEWVEMQKRIQAYVKEFMDTRFEGTAYAIYGDCLMVDECNADKYSKELKSGVHDGLVSFRKNSKTNKEFFKGFNERGLVNRRRPDPAAFTSFCGGGYRTHIGMVDGTLYGHVGKNYDFTLYSGLVEIKASEFYLAVEKQEAKNGQTND